MALEWQKPGKSKPEMVTTLEDLKDAANQRANLDQRGVFNKAPFGGMG